MRRLFAQARAHRYRTLVVEHLPAEGPVAEENTHLRAIDPKHSCTALLRLSFWRSEFDTDDISNQRSRDCIGYAILKKDNLPLFEKEEWHVFEAVMAPTPSRHRFLCCSKRYDFRVGSRRHVVSGSLYCQQNQVTKGCGHVALRSLLSGLLPEGEIGYERIYQILMAHREERGIPKRRPATRNVSAATLRKRFAEHVHLRAKEICGVLDGLGIRYEFERGVSIQKGKENRNDQGLSAPLGAVPPYPYDEVLYHGVESGAGSLLGFHVGRFDNDEPLAHVMPVVGHSFSEDSWPPRAKTGYRLDPVPHLRSTEWVGHFIIHDDNYGCNMSLPRHFLQWQHVLAAIALMPPGLHATGRLAEKAALSFLFGLLKIEDLPGANPWIERLVAHAATLQRRMAVAVGGTIEFNDEHCVLRTSGVRTADYLEHLGEQRDWELNAESASSLRVLRRHLRRCASLWLIELSFPELFGTNQRKVCEALVRTDGKAADYETAAPILALRVPGWWTLYDASARRLTWIESGFGSHTQLYRTKDG